MSQQGKRKTKFAVLLYITKIESLLAQATLHAFSILVWFSKIHSCKLGCAPASPAALFLCLTARIRQNISVASFCSCKFLWRINECFTQLGAL